MGCELCGKKETLYTTAIESTIMQVCKDCAAYGKILQAPPELRKKKTVIKEEELVPEIVEDYAILIRQAREKKKMTQEEVVKNIWLNYQNIFK